MKPRIQVRRRFTCGNIKDAELHQQRVINAEKTREVALALVAVGVGMAVFAFIAIVGALAG